MKDNSAVTMRRPILALICVLVFAGLVIFGGWYFFSLPRQFTEVDAGVLYRSGQGRPHQIRNAVRRYGIKTILCLRELDSERDTTWHAGEVRVARENNVAFLSWPTDSHKAVPESAQAEFLRLVQDPARRPVLVHCAQGKHRTGFFVALYRMVANGWSFGRAIQEMDSFGYGLASHEELMDSLRKIEPAALRQQVHLAAHAPVINRDMTRLLFSVSLWTLFGFAGQFFFFSRFLVQWIATEKRGRTHIPVAFWYLSLLGGVILTVYAIGRADIVITLGQGLGCLIYIRNLMIIQKNNAKILKAAEHGG